MHFLLLLFFCLNFPLFLLSVSAFPHPSLCLSHSVSICLFLLVSADLSTCQLFLKTGPCAFLVPFFLFSVVFHPSVVFCRRQHTHALFLVHKCTRTHRKTHSLTFCLKYILPLSSSLTLSKLHAHKNTHTVPITHSYTGIVFKCSNKYEWAQNDECMSK